MRWIVIVALLSGCGIKSDPLPVEDPALPEPGLSISGTAGIGVTTTIRRK